MKDGTDAVSDWAILNAMVNIAGGASWVSFHHGGGVGIGYSQHAGQVIVADGTPPGRKTSGARADERPAHGGPCGMWTPGMTKLRCARRLHIHIRGEDRGRPSNRRGDVLGFGGLIG